MELLMLVPVVVVRRRDGGSSTWSDPGVLFGLGHRRCCCVGLFNGKELRVGWGRGGVR